MIAIGIDVSKGRSTVAAVGEGKKVLHKPFDISHNKTDLAKLVTFVKTMFALSWNTQGYTIKWLPKLSQVPAFACRW